jgi:hypothetical protein
MINATSSTFAVELFIDISPSQDIQPTPSNKSIQTSVVFCLKRLDWGLATIHV